MMLSLITINYNNDLGLSKTICSVLNQNYNDLEYIIIDGGSNDESINIIKEYQHIITTWVSETDSGIYNAMNKGITRARGDYLLFMNSGDTFANDFVLSEIFRSDHSADILCGKANIVKNGNIIHTTNPPFFHTFSTYYQATINHQSTFIKRELFLKYGLYREDIRLNADYEFWIRTIILNNCSTEKLDFIVANYDLEGISNDPRNREESQREIQLILSHPVIARFVPDYENWFYERSEMQVMYWFKSKIIFYIPLRFIYHIAQWYSRLRARCNK